MEMFFISPKKNLFLQKLHLPGKNSNTCRETRDLVTYYSNLQELFRSENKVFNPITPLPRTHSWFERIVILCTSNTHITIDDFS